MPEWPKGTGCKPVGIAYGGSNPSGPTRDAPLRRGIGRAALGAPRSQATGPGAGRRAGSRSRFSATSSWLAMWVTPVRGSTWCGRPAARSADESWRVWALTTLSSARPWISRSGRSSLAASGSSGARLVDVGVGLRISEVALRVEGVVEAPVRDRGAGDGGMEDVGAAQDGERGEVAAEAPAADRHPRQVEARVLLRQRQQPIDLVFEDRSGHVAVDAALPRRAASRGAPAIDDDDREALVREPLRGEVRAACLHHPLGVGPSVGVEQHRKGHVVVGPVGEQERSGQAARADVPDRDVRRDERGRDRRCDRRAVDHGDRWARGRRG